MKHKALEFEHVMMAFGQLVALWDTASGDERVMLAQGLFQYLVYDLDKQENVDFRLHPWADQYLILRTDLYGGDDETEGDLENEKTLSLFQAMKCLLTLTRLWVVILSSVRYFIRPNHLFCSFCISISKRQNCRMLNVIRQYVIDMPKENQLAN